MSTNHCVEVKATAKLWLQVRRSIKTGGERKHVRTTLCCVSSTRLCGSCGNFWYRAEPEWSPTSFWEKWFSTPSRTPTQMGITSTNKKIPI